MKWEYMVEHLEADAHEWEGQLDEAGEGGWELVHIVEGHDGFYAVYTQPVEEGSCDPSS